MELIPTTIYLDITITNDTVDSNFDNSSCGNNNYCVDDKVSRQEKVKITSLRRSNFFCGYLDIAQLSSSTLSPEMMLSIPFPPQFNDVVDTYILYCNSIQSQDEDNINFIIHLRKLCIVDDQHNNILFRVFELSHFLDDDKLFSCAMKILYERYSHYKNSIHQLIPDIQHEIKLHLPYMFSYADDRNYPNAWIALNDGKIIRVEDTYYVTHLTVTCHLRIHVTLMSHGYEDEDGVDDHTSEDNVDSNYRSVDDRNVIITCYSGPVIPLSGIKLYTNGVMRYWTKKVGGHITYEVHYRDNVKHGPETQWIIKDIIGDIIKDTNDNNIINNILWSCNYANGQRNGEYKRYNDNGVLHEVINYLNDVHHGEHLTYHPDGITVFKKQFNVDGKIHGSWTEYYPNGTIAGQGINIPTIITGISQDVTMWYYPNDQGLEIHIVTSYNTNNDDLSSIVAIWYPHNVDSDHSTIVPQSQPLVSLSLPLPLTTEIVPVTSQVLKSLYTTVNDKTHGDRSEWYPSGNILSHCVYHDDEYHGLCRAWYDVDGSDDDTNLKYYHNYEHGKRHGQWKEWYSNNVLQGEYHYDNDVKHGVCRAWHPSGEIWYSAVYDNGVIDDSQPLILPSLLICSPSPYPPSPPYPSTVIETNDHE